MRILHIVHQYPPEFIGGVELNTQRLVTEQTRAGHEVALFYRRSAEGVGLERWEEESGGEIWAAHTGRAEPTARFLATFRHPALLNAFEQVLATVRPDIVHLQHLLGLPAGLVGRIQRAGVPFVVTLHDYWWLCANAQLLTNDTETICEGPAAWINCGRCALARAGQSTHLAPALAPLFAYRHHRLRPILAAARALIVPTPFTRDLYVRLMGLETSSIRVIPYGIPVPADTPPAPAPRDSAALRVVYVGGIARQKGVHVLLEAVRGLRAPLSLTLYGDLAAFPDYAAELRGLADERVTFAGRLPNERLLAALAGADGVVVPSIWYETAAMVIQEAFAAGVPVIASDLGALHDRVRHEEDGLLVPPNDPLALRAVLQRLLDEPALLPRLRVGIRPVDRIETQARAVEALYQEIVRSQTKTG